MPAACLLRISAGVGALCANWTYQTTATQHTTDQRQHKPKTAKRELPKTRELPAASSGVVSKVVEGEAKQQIVGEGEGEC